MGYYVRYFVVEDTVVEIGDIEAKLKLRDAAYSIQGDGDVKYDETIFASIELNLPHDHVFDEEMEEMREEVEAAKGRLKPTVLTTFDNTKTIIAVQMLFAGLSEDVIDKAQALYEVFFELYQGLLQCDNDGFYSKHKKILDCC